MRNRVKKVMSALGYSRKQFCVVLGVSYTSVYCVENQGRKLVGNALSRLQILECSLRTDPILEDIKVHPAALAGALELCVAATGDGEKFITSGATMTQVLSGAAGGTLYNSLLKIKKN